MITIDRPVYLKKLISKMDNGMIKVITGVRRCGKSSLLFDLFYDYLLEQGIPEECIIRIALDDLENEDLMKKENLAKENKLKEIEKENLKEYEKKKLEKEKKIQAVEKKRMEEKNKR